MKLIIAEINEKNSQLDKTKKQCLYNTMHAMSEDERDTFQDLLDEYSQNIATGKSVVSFEDVIHKMKDCWLEMQNTSNIIECDYCGEEVDDKTSFMKHMGKFHQTQFPEDLSHLNIPYLNYTDIRL